MWLNWIDIYLKSWICRTCRIVMETVQKNVPMDQKPFILRTDGLLTGDLRHHRGKNMINDLVQDTIVFWVKIRG